MASGFERVNTIIRSKICGGLFFFEKKKFWKMACNVTAKSGQSRGLEDALGATVKGKLEGKHWKKLHSAFYN